MAKRSATRELTDRNWDKEEKTEEAGQFVLASNDILKQREIKKAKRRNPDAESSAFSGFGGFSFKPMSSSTPFSFSVKPHTNGKSEESTDTKTNDSSTSAFSGKVSANFNKIGILNGTETKQGIGSSAYLQNLKSLNECLLSWTKKHVEKNPYCILTPIFKDYDKHLTELDKGEKAQKQSSSDKKSESAEEPKPTGDKSADELTSSGTAKSTDSATSSDKEADKEGSSAAGFTFSTAVSSLGAPPKPAPFTGFNFKSSLGEPNTGFSFASGTSKSSESKETASQDEDEYVPPKPEVTEIVEEDALYSKKCKLFYQKDGTWTERGVGHLHLKSLENKVQLIIRADTNLGNILLNIMLDSIPLQKHGKNNVSLLCIPNPPVNPKADITQPVPMLIRVKTGQDAEELLEKIKELKKS